MKNVNKKISNDFWDNLLSVYAISAYVISLFIEELLFYMAIAYAILIIILLLIAIKYINKNDNHDKNNSIPEK
jgi:heme/copper-type cytochrome/quinol oxidase subunit 2